jgi:uncharacterized protein (DUF983 family)
MTKWMDCPDCDDGKDYWDMLKKCPVCEGRMQIPVDMSEKGMIAAGLLGQGNRLSRERET